MTHGDMGSRDVLESKYVMQEGTCDGNRYSFYLKLLFIIWGTEIMSVRQPVVSLNSYLCG